MLALNSQPADIALSKNPMIFEFLSTDGSGGLYGAKGVRAELQMTGGFDINNGDEITLDWRDADGIRTQITFFAVASPTAEDEIPDSITGFGSFLEYWQAVAAAIQAHHSVSPFFKVYAETNTIPGISMFAEVIDIDDAWTVTWDLADWTTPNTVNVPNIAVTADTTPDNYKVELDIMFESSYESNEFELVASLEDKPGSDGKSFFDISGIIDSETRESLTLLVPSFTNTSSVRLDNSRRYYIRYRESYDNITNPAWSIGTIKKIICGGVSKEVFVAGDFLSGLDATNSLLTWYPDKKTVGPDQPEYIGWYNYTGSTTEISIRVELYDDTVEGVRTTFDYVSSNHRLSLKANEVGLILAGYENIGIDSFSFDIQKYTVQVLDYNALQSQSIVPLSQKRTYYVDKNYHHEVKYISYLNSFCVPETLRCLGYTTQDLQVSREESKRTLAQTYAATDDEQFQYDYDFEQAFIYRSGYLSKAEIKALQELLIYNKAYEVSSDGIIPLLIRGKKYTIAETRRFLNTITFNAIKALKSKSYSP